MIRAHIKYENLSPQRVKDNWEHWIIYITTKYILISPAEAVTVR